IDALVEDLEKFCRETFHRRLRSEFKAVMPPVNKKHLDGLDRVFCLPKFMPVEPEAFKADKFQNALLPGDLKDRQSRDDFISRLKTTIRWRECEDKETGAMYKESNTRIVLWSDGSQTLHIGAQVFELISHPMPIGKDQLYVRQNSHLYMVGPLREKITVHSQHEPEFGQTQEQSLRNRSAFQPVKSCVKGLMDLSINPVLDRERKTKEEQAQQRRGKSDNKNQRIPNVKPTAAPASKEVLQPDDQASLKPLRPPIEQPAGLRTKEDEEDSDSDVQEKEKVGTGFNKKSNVNQVKTNPKRKRDMLSDSE
ncbi:RNA polymerase-associated protein LEO1, partial [Drosophila navojoa]